MLSRLDLHSGIFCFFILIWFTSVFNLFYPFSEFLIITSDDIFLYYRGIWFIILILFFILFLNNFVFYLKLDYAKDLALILNKNNNPIVNSSLIIFALFFLVSLLGSTSIYILTTGDVSILEPSFDPFVECINMKIKFPTKYDILLKYHITNQSKKYHFTVQHMEYLRSLRYCKKGIGNPLLYQALDYFRPKYYADLPNPSFNRKMFSNNINDFLLFDHRIPQTRHIASTSSHQVCLLYYSNCLWNDDIYNKPGFLPTEMRIRASLDPNAAHLLYCETNFLTKFCFSQLRGLTLSESRLCLKYAKGLVSPEELRELEKSIHFSSYFKSVLNTIYHYKVRIPGSIEQFEFLWADDNPTRERLAYRNSLNLKHPLYRGHISVENEERAKIFRHIGLFEWKSLVSI